MDLDAGGVGTGGIRLHFTRGAGVLRETLRPAFLRCARLSEAHAGAVSPLLRMDCTGVELPCSWGQEREPRF
jgi:hypothetical protein